MADLSITNSNVVAGSNALIVEGSCGETITAGQVVYQSATTKKWLRADSDSPQAEVRKAIGMALNGGSLDQPLSIIKRGRLTLGASLTPGALYYLSSNPGGICLVSDVVAGDYICLLGVASTSSVLNVKIQFPNVASVFGIATRTAQAAQTLGGLGQTATATDSAVDNPPTFTANFTTISSLPAQISLTRATTGAYFNGSGVLQTAAIDTARFDHDPSTHAAKGILGEGQRTKVLLQSNNFTDAQWHVANAAIAASSNNSPDGTTDACTLTIAASAGSIIYNPLSVASGTYTGTIWARVTTGTGKVYIDLHTDASIAVQTCSLTTDWLRFTVSYAHPGGTTMYFCVGQKSDGSTTDASPSVEIFGAQVELGSFATSYTPTTTAEVIRSADVLSSNSPLTGYLAAGPSIWEFQDIETGTIARSAYSAGTFDWPANKWYRSMGVYPAGSDISSHMTVGSAY